MVAYEATGDPRETAPHPEENYGKFQVPKVLWIKDFMMEKKHMGPKTYLKRGAI